MEEWVRVTTENQFFYYLNSGEVVGFRLGNSEVYVVRLESGAYQLVINRPLLPSLEYIAESEAQVRQFYRDMKRQNACFWVHPGAVLREYRAPLWKRAFGRLVGLFFKAR